MLRRLLCILIVAAALLAPGCTSGDHARGPYRPGAVERDIARAEDLYQQARPLRASQPERAEELLRQALTADLYHGPAHNDLGVLLLQQERLYQAAREFAWARKLMPGHPDPRVNLAIALERGRKHQEALAAARAALEVRPGHLPAHQAIAVIQCRNGLADADTAGHLAAIVERSADADWRRWAETWRLKLADGGWRR